MNEEKTKPQRPTQEVKETIKRWRKANPKATLTDIEVKVDEELSKLRQLLVEETAQGVIDELPEDQQVLCPECTRPMMRNGKKKRRLRTKGGKQIVLEREQMRCHQCGMTLFPPG